jgi:hypothetical protein
LKIIFTQYQYSNFSEIPADALRRAMSILYAAEEKFQLGKTDDAAEVYVSLNQDPKLLTILGCFTWLSSSMYERKGGR